MDKVEALPSTPRIYRVQTCSGTVRISSRYSEGTTWERRPAATTTMVGTYDFQPVPVTLTNEDWKIGGNASLTISDETYLTGQSWHRTGTIISISELMPE